MLRTIVVLLFLFCSIYSQAQVGINNSNPDANSILDLNSTNKGLLIPRMLTAQRESMVSLKPAQGMMVYDTQLDVIFIFYSNKWYALNPWKTDYRTYNDSSASSMTAMFGGSTNYGNIGIGVDIPTEKFQVNGKIKATEFIGNGATPLGGIILWSGTIAPTGWALCDGDTANGYTTPNLKNRFVVGYNPSDWRYDWPGNLSQKGTSTSDIGGAATVALNLSQMPRHNHGVTDPKHKHQTTVTSVFGQGCTDNDDCERHFYNSRTTVFKYSSSVKTGVTIKDAGDDAAHENRPPYYTLAYIMRVY
jgi:microcystin-dependent protein